MRRTVELFSLMLAISLAMSVSVAQAEELVSGLQVGDSIAKFRSDNCAMNNIGKGRL